MASVTPGDVVPKVDFIKFRGLLGRLLLCTSWTALVFNRPLLRRASSTTCRTPWRWRFEAEAEERSEGRQSEAAQSLRRRHRGLLPPNRNENFMGEKPAAKSAPVPPPPSSKPGAPDAQLLQALTTAPDGACYVLTSSEGVEACEEALAAYPSLKATIIAPANGVALSSDGDWVSARPQDLEGELVAPVALGERR